MTAEVFAAALSAAARYRPENATAAPWLFTIAQHTLARSLRRGRVEARARRRLGIREAFELEDSQIDQVQAALAGEQWVAELLEGPARGSADRDPGADLDELPYHEIADWLQTSELVIRKRVSRGLAILRKRLEDGS